MDADNNVHLPDEALLGGNINDIILHKETADVHTEDPNRPKATGMRMILQPVGDGYYQFLLEYPLHGYTYKDVLGSRNGEPIMASIRRAEEPEFKLQVRNV